MVPFLFCPIAGPFVILPAPLNFILWANFKGGRHSCGFHGLAVKRKAQKITITLITSDIVIWEDVVFLIIFVALFFVWVQGVLFLFGVNNFGRSSCCRLPRVIFVVGIFQLTFRHFQRHEERRKLCRTGFWFGESDSRVFMFWQWAAAVKKLLQRCRMSP